MISAKVLAVLSLVTVSLCAYEEEQKYYRTPPPPRILSHKQAQNHDGGFKFAFAAENGLAQTEVIAPDGSRNGGYTYVDPHGKTISVKYTAGKEGFRILEGDHVPRDPNPVIPAKQPQYNAPHYAREPPDDGSYKPEKYEKPEYVKPAYEKSFFAPTKGFAYQPPKYQLQQQSPYVPQERPAPPVPVAVPGPYKPQFVVPQKQLYQSPRYYEPAAPESPASNSVEQGQEQEKKEPEYHDEPGKPYSFGAGYAFHFGS